MSFLEVFPTGMIQANCVLLGDEESRSMVIIDPGDEAGRILSKVRDAGFEVTAILHTHAHLDHAGATAELARLLPEGTAIGLHPADEPLYSSLREQGRRFGMEIETPPAADMSLDDGREISLGKLKLEVLHTPGHSPGSVSFLLQEDSGNTVIVGDVLFAGSIGRTDLWGGSFEILENSIRTRLYTLDDATRVICGHGPDTTIGREKASNPFVRGL